jgi:hypothetical protein
MKYTILNNDPYTLYVRGKRPIRFPHFDSDNINDCTSFTESFLFGNKCDSICVLKPKYFNYEDYAKEPKYKEELFEDEMEIDP